MLHVDIVKEAETFAGTVHAGYDEALPCCSWTQSERKKISMALCMLATMRPACFAVGLGPRGRGHSWQRACWILRGPLLPLTGQAAQRLPEDLPGAGNRPEGQQQEAVHHRPQFG